MHERVLRLVTCVFVAVCLAGIAAPVAAAPGDGEDYPLPVSITGSMPGGVTLGASSVREGDLLFCVGPQAPELAGVTWQRIADREQVRWQARALADGDLEMSFDGASLVPGDELVVGIDRNASDGSVLQTSLQLTVGSAGTLVPGTVSVVRLRRGVALTLRTGSRLALDGLERDEAGRVRVGVFDDRLAALLAEAEKVEPYLTAEAQGTPDAESVLGQNDYDMPYTGYACSNTHVGTFITINSAPAGSTIQSMDVYYRVYHSIDISRVQTSIFRWASNHSEEWIYLYQGNQSGTKWLEQTRANLTNWAGKAVNYQYILGCCNRVNAADAGYLDRWQLTLWYDAGGGGGTIDLVADSITAGPTTVAAGASTSAVFQGHVGGSGTVGGGFGIGFYLSPDTNITTGDVLLQTLNAVWASVPGDTFGFGSPGVSLTIPGGTAAGTYYLGMIVDNGGVIAETNEANNVAWTTITVASSAAKPNLEAVSCSVTPTSTTAGSTLSFTSRGRNSGTVGASDFVWGIYLSTDSTISPTSDTGMMALDVPGGWNAGYDTGDVTRSVPLPGSLPDGTYYVGIYFDTGNAVSETNESDNYCSAMFTVGSGGGGGGGGATTWILPAAAAATGFGGAVWSGQVEITNATAATRTATLYYVPKGQAWPGSVLSGPHSIGANQALFIDNPLGALSPTTGLLYVVFDQAGPRASSRVFALQPDGSTYGQGIPGIPLTLVPNGTHVIAPVHSQPGVYHANLGLVHPATGSYTVEVSIYSSGGSLLALKSYPRSQAWEQIDNVFADMGLGSLNVQGAWIKVRVTAGSAVWAYVSLVDDRTKDPTFLWDLATLLP